MCEPTWSMSASVIKHQSHRGIGWWTISWNGLDVQSSFLGPLLINTAPFTFLYPYNLALCPILCSLNFTHRWINSKIKERKKEKNYALRPLNFQGC